MAAIDVPEVVRNKARSCGAGDWLDALPMIVSELEVTWQLAVGRVYADATEAWVAEADLADGRSAVLKICIPRGGEAAGRESTVLRLARGVGCVELLAADDERRAMLLERLGPSLHRLGPPADERHRILTGLARRLWRPASGLDPAARAVLSTGAAKAEWLIEQIVTAWQELGRPCSRSSVDHAIACGERRRNAHDGARAMLVHGDVHQWNALAVPLTDRQPPAPPSDWKLIDPDGGPSGWKLIDPDGLVAQPEYDLGVIMREDPVESAVDVTVGDPRRRARRLAALTDCDEEAIWEWGVVERVSTGLIATRIGLQPVGRDMLAVADRLAEVGS